MTSIFYAEKLKVKRSDTRVEMGKQAAEDIALEVDRFVRQRGECNMIFAAAPSQIEMLQGLLQYNQIAWDKVNAFHMDEYIGLNASAPQGFGNFLKQSIFSKLPFKSVYTIEGATADFRQECDRYAALLREYPVDIVCMGIGENGHIAFNDPHVADFHDPQMVKVVNLDTACRMQQVHDGCFEKLEDVPLYAITLTIPALMAAHSIFCVVPASTKAPAVRETVTGRISENCPATVLRTQEQATLYLDADSSSLL